MWVLSIVGQSYTVEIKKNDIKNISVGFKVNLVSMSVDKAFLCVLLRLKWGLSECEMIWSIRCSRRRQGDHKILSGSGL